MGIFPQSPVRKHTLLFGWASRSPISPCNCAVDMNTAETPHILSVEDHPQTRLLLKHLMGSYDVAFASGADEALNAIESDSFDVLLLDINLGSGKSGVELLHTVRNREDTAEIPAIALTAYAMPGDREDLLEKGFDGYVSKPFTYTELTSAIEQTLSTT